MIHKTLPCLPALALASLTPASAAVVFADDFNRADHRNIDSSLTGITNNTGTPMAADGVYSQPWLDPNNGSPNFGAQDTNAANGGGAQILTSTLQLAVGVGTSNAYINHNFTNDYLKQGFSITVDITGYRQATNAQGGGFALGMSLADAVASGDSWNAAKKFQDAFPGASNTAGQVSISSFWLMLRGDGTLAWGTAGDGLNNTTTTAGWLGSASVGSKTGTISAVFSPFTDFNAGTSVGYEVFFNGTSRGTGTFNWSGTDANYIGLDSRDDTAVSFDNFAINAVVPEPSSALLGAFAALGLLRRRRGAASRQ